MKTSYSLPLLFWLMSIMCLTGQDIHMTDYRTTSNFFNPAMTGQFLGHYKIQCSFRTQYERTYEQALAGIQTNINSPLNKKHWIGVGVNFMYDKSGSLSLNAANGDLMLGYHMPLGKKQKNTISLGGSLGYASLFSDPNKYKSEATILGIADPDKKSFADLNSKALYQSAGIYLNSIISKKQQFNIGIAMVRLNSPKFTSAGTLQNIKWGSRLNLSTGYRQVINPMITLAPSVYYTKSEGQSNINTQMMTDWKIAPDKSWNFVTGLAYRWQESANLILGYKSDKLYVSFCFDFLTAASASILKNPGALELGAYYIIHKNIIPKTKPIIFCPSL